MIAFQLLWTKLFIDSTTYSTLLKHFIFHFYLIEVALSDSGHKTFWKRETGSMFSLQKTLFSNS